MSATRNILDPQSQQLPLPLYTDSLVPTLPSSPRIPLELNHSSPESSVLSELAESEPEHAMGNGVSHQTRAPDKAKKPLVRTRDESVLSDLSALESEEGDDEKIGDNGKDIEPKAKKARKSVDASGGMGNDMAESTKRNKGRKGKKSVKKRSQRDDPELTLGFGHGRVLSPDHYRSQGSSSSPDKGKGRLVPLPSDQDPTRDFDSTLQVQEMKAKTDGLLDEMQEELTCGLCAGLFIDAVMLSPCGHAFCGSCVASWLKSYRINPSLIYANPTPAINEAIRSAREYAAAHNGAVPPTSGPPVGSTGSASGEQARVGVSATPDDGLSCPQCRLKPLAGATHSHLIKNLAEVLLKNRPEAARSSQEIAEAKEIFKHGDLLSFPQPIITNMTSGGSGVATALPPFGGYDDFGVRRRATYVEYWRPCSMCGPLREGETLIENGGTRYVCPVPVPDPNNPAERSRAMPANGMLPDNHLLCSQCNKIYPEALAQSCGKCGESACSLRRSCTIPRITELGKLHDSESAFAELDFLTNCVDVSYMDIVSWLGLFNYNYVELAYFLCHVGDQYHRMVHPAQSQAARRDGLGAANDDVVIRPPARTDTRYTTDRICQDIGSWLLSAEAVNQGGIRGMFERADQQYIAIHPGEPERLCWDCGESLFKSGVYEWWMREYAKPEVRARIPDVIKNREACKKGRKCPYQCHVEHCKTYAHLSEALPEDQMATMSHQIAPNMGSVGASSDRQIFETAVASGRELYGLKRFFSGHSFAHAPGFDDSDSERDSIDDEHDSDVDEDDNEHGGDSHVAAQGRGNTTDNPVQVGDPVAVISVNSQPNVDIGGRSDDGVQDDVAEQVDLQTVASEESQPAVTGSQYISVGIQAGGEDPHLGDKLVGTPGGDSRFYVEGLVDRMERDTDLRRHVAPSSFSPVAATTFDNGIEA